MGVVHVLTGPDHLSAIATLSVNLGNCRAFFHGVRWGIGHSIGLIVVGTIFIVLENMHPNDNSNADDSGGGDDANTDDDSNDNDNDNDSRSIQIPEQIENIAECFVGIFMLALGSYSLFNAYRIRKEMLHSNGRLYHHTQNDNNNDSANDNDDHDGENGMRRLIIDNDDDDATNSIYSAFVDTDSNHSSSRSNNGVSKQYLSLCIGIVHGVAGPGGVLGVIPAVRLHNVWYSIVYLGSFCITSILVMGCFAACYGTFSSRLTQSSEVFAYRMELFSASLSIVVGCTWLSLLYLGILHDIFP
ncbi:hypothetical protein FRACYDRAFT_178407 [Fragilariopsis cylindrus CCMP1102]|uniref:Urease accessory protein UreH-like transmembrane domain-containing protein n=1 Tax=Fragilariopsis cylindrus CCMP1102 TaxID=635003 RepID=A0A1E7FY21_9STRA|nr:hypothetical protein FRACYDRAFT_178407 [Fragilariopsis cylindrus CCMP1102]|eukprot:OEU23035.1 hypothetical protein FRACYDRAFT_178407 [Fragilariopsis cylindrus CCMP1102]